MLNDLKDIFNSVYLLVYGEEYVFRNKRVEASLQKFLRSIPSGAGTDWLYSFTLFQFAYYDGMKTRFDRIYVNWIFGDKALKRWNDRTEEQIYYAQKFRVKIGVKKPLDKLPAIEFRRAERKRFEDKMRQLVHCDENALFSDDCNSHCELYEKCKKHFVCNA